MTRRRFYERRASLFRQCGRQPAIIVFHNIIRLQRICIYNIHILYERINSVTTTVRLVTQSLNNYVLMHYVIVIIILTLTRPFCVLDNMIYYNNIHRSSSIVQITVHVSRVAESQIGNRCSLNASELRKILIVDEPTKWRDFIANIITLYAIGRYRIP